jgi:hypothetical protein
MIWLLFGCTSGPLQHVELDDGCAALVEGGAEEALWRLDCYRQVLGLQPAAGEATLHAAAQAHADYMALLGQLTHEEAVENEGYTGEYVWNRVEAAGWTFANQEIGEVLASGLGPADSVDLWMGSVYHRAPLVGLDLRHVGFGEAGGYTGMVLIGDYPGTTGAEVVYPPDGMRGVPVDFDSDSESPDPVAGAGVVGFPVTWSVANVTDGPDITEASAEMSGPDGDVDFLLLDPDSDPWLTDMLALVPLEPLEPASAYEVELSATVHGEAVSRTVRFDTE